MFSITQPKYQVNTSQYDEEYNIILQAQKNLSAFKPLYEKHYQSIYLYIYRRCVNVDDCADLCSKVFEKAMLNIQKYKPMGYAFKSWLYKLAQNVLTDYFRAQVKERKLWINDEGLENIIDEVVYENINEERIQNIISALVKLEQNEQNLIVMKYFEKMSYEQMAEIENSNVNTIRVRIHRVINKIKLIVKK